MIMTYLIDVVRYFEGQLASISEGDDEFDVEASPVKVTEAAKKVLVFFYLSVCLFLCVHAFSFLLRCFSIGFFA